MEAYDACKLRLLEDENTSLKAMLPDLELDKEIPKEFL